MNLNAAQLLDHVFNFLDAPIQNYGVYLYLVFVWLALLVIAWIFSRGLRRKRPWGNSAAVVPGIILTMQPTSQPTPPIISIEVDQVWDGEDETTD